MACILIAAISVFLAGPFIALAGEHLAAHYTGSAQFQRMKGLVGAWEGTSDMGKTGEKVSV